jgi:Flp pilus assembly protein TadG
MVILERMMPYPVLSERKLTKSQGMVEFALALPFLLLIMLGLLEVGRLIFMYSTVTSASREAVRYGSATGLNVTGGVARYKDCAGIKAAAQKMDFLGVIDDINIIIAYDHGPSSSVFSGCPPATILNGDRIKVTVSASFLPTSGLVKLKPVTLTSFSARTLLAKVEVIQP